MVGIVLDVHPHERLRDTIHNRELPRGALRDPRVLQEGIQTDVDGDTKQKAWCRKLLAASNNLEDFLLNVAFKGSVKLVSVLASERGEVTSERVRACE